MNFIAIIAKFSLWSYRNIEECIFCESLIFYIIKRYIDLVKNQYLVTESDNIKEAVKSVLHMRFVRALRSKQNRIPYCFELLLICLNLNLYLYIKIISELETECNKDNLCINTKLCFGDVLNSY